MRLIDLETRVPEAVAAALKKLAASNERSVAAELRVALQRHLAEGAPAREELREP